jgi:S-adenosylmethionine uptake transporter
MEKLYFDFNKAKGIAWFILNLIIGVSNDVIMKFLGGNISVYEVSFLRFLFGTLIFIPFILANRKNFKTSRLLLHVARGGILSAGITAYCLGLTSGKLAVATTINFTIPIFILILATRFLNEKFSMTKVLATLVGFAGIVIIINPTSVDFNSTSLMLIMSAFLFASLDVINKKFVSVESMMSMLFYSNLFATLFSAPLALSNWTMPDPHSLLLLFILGAGANLILYCLLKSFSYIEVSAVAPYRYLELVFAITLGYIFFKEKFDTTNWIGAGVIIFSTLIMSYEYLLAKRLKKRPTASAR